MTDEYGLKQSIEELVEKKTALEKRIFELEKENEDLKNQIEQMKCCENCEYENFEKYHGGKCNLGNYKTCGNWEIRK